ncbi:MAG: hypothetical protein AMS27_17400, partial [Bacteroides sp. SM23_62_1]
HTLSIEWIFFTLASGGIFIFRKKMKHIERPYKTLGYPSTPAIFIVINIWFVINILVNKPLHMLIGRCFLLIGIPVFLIFKRKTNNTGF